MYRCPTCDGFLRLERPVFDDPVLKYSEIMQCNTCQKKWRVFQRAYKLPETGFYSLVVAMAYTEENVALVPESHSATTPTSA